LRNSIYLLLVSLFFRCGLCFMQDLRALRSELNQKMKEKKDAKLAVVDAEWHLEKKFRSHWRPCVWASQRSRGQPICGEISATSRQVENTKKKISALIQKKDDTLDNILLKINFIENFLGNRHKITLAMLPQEQKSTGSPVAKEPAKKTGQRKSVFAAYQFSKKAITINQNRNFKIFAGLS